MKCIIDIACTIMGVIALIVQVHIINEWRKINKWLNEETLKELLLNGKGKGDTDK